MPFNSLWTSLPGVRAARLGAVWAGVALGSLLFAGQQSHPCHALENAPSLADARPALSLETQQHLARQKAQDREMRAGLHGQLIESTLPPSPFLGQRRVTAWIYLPPGYANSRARYPVAYLLHGALGEARDWLVDAKAQRVAENLIERQKVAPLILIAFDAFGPQGVNTCKTISTALTARSLWNRS